VLTRPSRSRTQLAQWKHVWTDEPHSCKTHVMKWSIFRMLDCNSSWHWNVFESSLRKKHKKQNNKKDKKGSAWAKFLLQSNQQWHTSSRPTIPEGLQPWFPWLLSMHHGRWWWTAGEFYVTFMFDALEVIVSPWCQVSCNLQLPWGTEQLQRRQR